MFLEGGLCISSAALLVYFVCLLVFLPLGPVDPFSGFAFFAMILWLPDVQSIARLYSWIGQRKLRSQLKMSSNPPPTWLSRLHESSAQTKALCCELPPCSKLKGDQAPLLRVEVDLVWHGEQPQLIVPSTIVIRMPAFIFIFFCPTKPMLPHFFLSRHRVCCVCRSARRS
jgi:hypothetical protein